MDENIKHGLLIMGGIALGAVMLFAPQMLWSADRTGTNQSVIIGSGDVFTTLNLTVGTSSSIVLPADPKRTRALCMNTGSFAAKIGGLNTIQGTTGYPLGINSTYDTTNTGVLWGIVTGGGSNSTTVDCIIEK